MSGQETTRADGPSERVRVRQAPERASYDLDAALAVLDEAVIAHVGIVHDSAPVVIPMAYGRVERTVYLHGGNSSRLLRAIGAGAQVCLTVTLVDGLVMARSAFKHSMNYRSVVVLGQGRAVTEPEELLIGLRAATDHNVPGRWDSLRAPTRKELAATTVVAVDLDECSVKTRSGGPLDFPEDLDQPVWAGVIPLHVAMAHPVPHGEPPGSPPDLKPGLRAM